MHTNLLLFTSTVLPAMLHGQAMVKPNQAVEYKVQVISTSFTVPVLRFTPLKKDAAETDHANRYGNTSFFNSIGAGVGYYWGRMTEVTDATGKVVHSEMTNTVGIQTGFLFAGNTGGAAGNNNFAWVVSVSVLSFQAGYGYEFGAVAAGQKRCFFTLAYGLPVSKLVRGGCYKIKCEPLTPAQLEKGFIK